MFIPIRDDTPTFRKPYATVTLIVINCLVFLYAYSLGFKGFQIFTFQFGYIPYEFVSGHEIYPEIGIAPWMTAFTSMFMHGGWMHLIGNMLFLWIFGNNIEDYFGPVTFVLFYLVSGLAAIALYTLFGTESQIPLVGASGAIAGVMGAYIILHPKAKITILMVLFLIQFFEMPAKIVLGIWFVIQLFFSLTDSTGSGGTAYLAHVGGFLFGFLLLKILVKFKGPGAAPSGGQRVYRVKW